MTKITIHIHAFYPEYPEDTSVYDIEELTQNKGETFNLYYNKDSQWSEEVKGEQIPVSLFDHGNGVILTLNKKKIDINYSELEQILVLLKYREIKENHQFKLLKLQEFK